MGPNNVSNETFRTKVSNESFERKFRTKVSNESFDFSNHPSPGGGGGGGGRGEGEGRGGGGVVLTFSWGLFLVFLEDILGLDRNALTESFDRKWARMWRELGGDLGGRSAGGIWRG